MRSAGVYDAGRTRWIGRGAVAIGSSPGTNHDKRNER